MEAIAINTTPVSRKFNDNVIELYPDKEHEFVMTTAQVAKGYGVTDNVVRSHKSNHSDEIHEGKHFFCVEKINAKKKTFKQTLWTKLGVIYLGFFIKSERAKQFRKFAADLVLDTIEKKHPGRKKALGKKLEITEDQFPETLREKKYISESRLLNIGSSLAQSITMQTWQTPGSKLKPSAYKDPVMRKINLGIPVMYREPLYDIEDVKKYILYFIENAKFGEDVPRFR